MVLLVFLVSHMGTGFAFAPGRVTSCSAKERWRVIGAANIDIGRVFCGVVDKSDDDVRVFGGHHIFRRICAKIAGGGLACDRFMLFDLQRSQHRGIIIAKRVFVKVGEAKDTAWIEKKRGDGTLQGSIFFPHDLTQGQVLTLISKAANANKNLIKQRVEGQTKPVAFCAKKNSKRSFMLTLQIRPHTEGKGAEFDVIQAFPGCPQELKGIPLEK